MIFSGISVRDNKNNSLNVNSCKLQWVFTYSAIYIHPINILFCDMDAVLLPFPAISTGADSP